ncbi:MAG: glycosyltransferase family 2 protein [Alphaproteobacteria bacterium]
MNGLDVIVTSYNTRDLLAACLDSLRRHAPARSMRVTVVDNASTDGSADLVRQRYPEVELVAFDTNRGYGRATNRGLRHLEYDMALLLNADTEVTAGCLDRLANCLEQQPEVGIVGPRQTTTTGRYQLSCGGKMTLPGEAVRWLQHRQLSQNNRGVAQSLANRNGHGGKVCWVSGSAMMIRREALRRTGLFDEKFFLYFEDIDICLRVAKAGFQVCYLPEAQVIHHGGASAALLPWRAEYEYRRSQILFWSKHGTPLGRAIVRSWIGLRSLLAWGACRAGLTADPAGERTALQRRILTLARKGAV